MIAKVIAYGADRAEALARLDAALARDRPARRRHQHRVPARAARRRRRSAPATSTPASSTGCRRSRCRRRATPRLARRPQASFGRDHSRDETSRSAARSRGGQRSRRAARRRRIRRAAAARGIGTALPAVRRPCRSGPCRDGCTASSVATRGSRRRVACPRTARSRRWTPTALIWVHADGASHRLRPSRAARRMETRLADARAATSARPTRELRAPMPGAVVAVHVADGARRRARATASSRSRR